mgnify:CR=1 FL=1
MVTSQVFLTSRYRYNVEAGLEEDGKGRGECDLRASGPQGVLLKAAQSAQPYLVFLGVDATLARLWCDSTGGACRPPGPPLLSYFPRC